MPIDPERGKGERGLGVRCFPDLESLSLALVDAFVQVADRQGGMSVALSGGTTPQSFYEDLAKCRDLDWRRVHLFMADERWVPPTDPSSNERMIRENLVSRIEIPGENFHPMFVDSDPETAAHRYEQALRDRFPGSATFDLALLGLGEDGHTASIFPGVPVPEGRWAYPTIGPKPPPLRITLSAACLAASRQVWFLAAGASKREAVGRVWTGELLPATQVASAAPQVVWWLDEAANPDQSSMTS